MSLGGHDRFVPTELLDDCQDHQRENVIDHRDNDNHLMHEQHRFSDVREFS